MIEREQRTGQLDAPTEVEDVSLDLIFSDYDVINALDFGRPV